MAITIAIATHKGGTGKTVTTMSLGAGLAKNGKKTLLIDLDPQGHCSLGLGVELNDRDLTLKDFFAEPSTFPIKRVIHSTNTENLFIAPSTIRLAPIGQSLYMKPKREEILKKGLNSVQNDFEYILLDCPPTLGVLAETGITAADFVIIPCQMEARAADGLVDLLDLIYTLKGENFQNYRILITKMDNRKSVTNEVIMEQLSQWKQKFFKAKIPLNESLNQMQMARTDIFSYDAKGKGAKAYWELTKEILKNGNK